MVTSPGGGEIQTLEPLIDAVRGGIEDAGWTLSGLQKTTSHEFEGRWAGESTRSAYLFFHRDDLPDDVSLEAFLDETPRGLRGNLSLVLDGPQLERLGSVRAALERVGGASGETLPHGYRTPISLRLTLPEPQSVSEAAEVQFRIKLTIPRQAVLAGTLAVSSLSARAVTAFETLLERPELAELLPPVID